MFDYNLGMQDLRLLVSGGQDGSLSVLHLASGDSYLHISLHTAEVPSHSSLIAPLATSKQLM